MDKYIGDINLKDYGEDENGQTTYNYTDGNGDDTGIRRIVDRYHFGQSGAVYFFHVRVPYRIQLYHRCEHGLRSHRCLDRYGTGLDLPCDLFCEQIFVRTLAEDSRTTG